MEKHFWINEERTVVIDTNSIVSINRIDKSNFQVHLHDRKNNSMPIYISISDYNDLLEYIKNEHDYWAANDSEYEDFDEYSNEDYNEGSNDNNKYKINW